MAGLQMHGGLELQAEVPRDVLTQRAQAFLRRVNAGATPQHIVHVAHMRAHAGVRQQQAVGMAKVITPECSRANCSG
jgi:hypothetical protein